VPSGDVPAAAAALTELLRDPDARAAVLTEADGVLSRYSWPEAARQTMDALASAAGKRMRDVTVIIVSFNTRQELEACLASIAAAPPSAAHRIVVVDNASSDGTPEAIRRNWPAVRLVASDRNLGSRRRTTLPSARPTPSSCCS